MQIYGMRNNASGRFTLQVDGQELHTYNLRSDVVQCELFVDDYLSDGTHNLTLTLAGTDNSNYTGTEGHASQSPVFHLTEILYVNHLISQYPQMQLLGTACLCRV